MRDFWHWSTVCIQRVTVRSFVVIVLADHTLSTHFKWQDIVMSENTVSSFSHHPVAHNFLLNVKPFNLLCVIYPPCLLTSSETGLMDRNNISLAILTCAIRWHVQMNLFSASERMKSVCLTSLDVFIPGHYLERLQGHTVLTHCPAEARFRNAVCSERTKSLPNVGINTHTCAHT